LNRYYGEGHRYLERMPDGETTYELGPGDGLYLPPHTPHMVKTFDPVAISLSAAFYTETTENLVNIHSFNSQLAKLRLPSAPPGSHPAADRTKAFLWRGLRRGTQAVRKVRGG
jgi:ribosomal protein L16 Arg81 hydroxylase